MDDNLGAKRDDLYRELMELHQGLSDEEAHALNAKLILIMMNEIGDAERLRAIFAQIRAN